MRQGQQVRIGQFESFRWTLGVRAVLGCLVLALG